MKAFLFLLGALSITPNFYSQVGIGTTTPSPASMLEVSSTSDEGDTYGGFMPPRVPDNDARDLIAPSPMDVGLLVFVESSGCLQIWNGSEWENMKCISPLGTLIGIQEFETTPSSPLLPIINISGGSYQTGNGLYPASPKFVSPTRGYGKSDGNATVELGPIDASSFTSATFRLHLASFSLTNGNGADSPDFVSIAISIDNGVSYSQELTVFGGSTTTSNNKWDFSALGEASTVYDGDNVATSIVSFTGVNGKANVQISGIPNASNIRIKILIHNDQTSELWVIDDAEIYGL